MKLSSVVQIICYTDPLCCWSWGMEPVFQRIERECGRQIEWRFCMGGLIPSWQHFSDPVNSVTRPLQMGPVWMHAAQITGMPMDCNIWYRDPPASSYPSCIAFKAMELQSASYAVTFLHMLRDAVMTKGINIGEADSIMLLAKQFDKLCNEFNLDLFIHDFKYGNGLAAFKKDLEETKIKNIKRFPSLILKGCQNSQVIISGYKTYDVVLKAIKKVSPEPEELDELLKRVE